MIYVEIRFDPPQFLFFFETANFIKQPNLCSRRTGTGETDNTNKRRRI